MRIGNGYDLHRLAADRKLILGGVEIEHPLGLLGHSDADCLTHAVIDALLGAAALGDIGGLFPDSDPKYQGISSLILLDIVSRLLRKSGYQIQNIDSTIVAQQPRMSPFIPAMRETLAKVLEIDISQISVKAKTGEEIGVIGTQQAIACFATALIIRSSE